MADESTSYSDLISRRRFVELTGVTGAAALAGCDGDGGDTTETPEGTSGPGKGGTATPAKNWFPKKEHISVETTNPANMQFNPFNSEGSPAIADRLLFEKFAQYNYADSTFKPAGLSEWGLEGDTFTMKLRKGLTWSNGKKVTADDLLLQLRLGEFDEAPYWNYVEDVKKVDERTVELTVTGVNQVVLEASLFASTMIKTDQETYGSWLDKLQNNEATKKDLRGFVDDDPVTNGPFVFDKADGKALNTSHVKKHDKADSPWAKNINFGNYTFEAGGNNQQRLNALKSLSVDSDFSLSVPARAMSTFPDAIEEANYYDVWGFGIYPNHNHKHAGDRAVRQAIAYAINRQQCVNNSLPRAKSAADYALGISDADGNQKKWLGDAAEDYRTYGKDKVMKKKVDEVMTNAGYSKVDGTWTDQDGNTVKLPVSCPSGWGDWVSQAQTINQNLRSVGFESSFKGVAGFYSSGTPLKSGDFVLGTGPWLHGGPLTHPYFSLQHNLSKLQIAGQEVKANYPGWTPEWGGSNASITVPSRTGSGETTVNPTDMIGKMSQTNDKDKMQDMILDLAWVSNVDLPTIPIVDKVLQQWLTSDDWTVPEDIDSVPESKVQFAPTWMPRKGLMNWKGKK